jgi:tRNA-dihydrouridine synthase
MEDQRLIQTLVKTLHEFSFYYFKQNRELDVPVTCKIRIFPDDEDTIEYVKRLEKSGCKSN